jgi:transcriptional regulator with XRE-family HTH domain
LASRDIFDREYRAIIAALQRHRIAAGLIQWDLARALGTDQSQISTLERNASAASTSWIIRGFAAPSA